MNIRVGAGLAGLCLTLILNLASLDAQGQNSPPETDRKKIPTVPLAGLDSQRGAAADQAVTSSLHQDFDALVKRLFTQAPGSATPAGGPSAPPIKVIEDPYEPLNRSFYAFDDALLHWLLRPIVAGYTCVVPKPPRRCIGKAGKNLAYPQRLINTLLQGKFVGALTETGRFLINSTIGLVGLFDPAKRLGLKEYNEDFGRTFAFYGSGSGSFLMLPFFGPSNRRDTLALPLNIVSDPASYLPGAIFFFKVNTLSFDLPAYERMRATAFDPYVLARDYSALRRENEATDFQPQPTKKEPAPTLEAIFLDVEDPNFPFKGQEGEAPIPDTRRKLPYSYWLQRHEAPLVFILPGVGTHRFAKPALALAEMVYDNGFSVVTISNAMNWEFMQRAATVAVPGYTPADVADVYNALDCVYVDLQGKYPGRFNSTALMGVSLGALHALFISSYALGRQAGGLSFDRIIAVNPPVDLLHVMSELDEYFNAPLEWPPAQRAARIKAALLKAVDLAEKEDLGPNTELPFDQIESRFLIGLNFRALLRDVIYSSQKRENLGVLKTKFRSLTREPVYDEIQKYSFVQYVKDFVLPYYERRMNYKIDARHLLGESCLWSIGKDLKRNKNLRVYINRNDFLERKQDIEWFQATLDSRLTIFDEGGHLGNLHLTRVQNKIMESLPELKTR